MALDANSLAAAVGSSVDNVQFEPAANNVPRKILIIGTYLPAKTGVVAEVPVNVLSPEDAGDQFGFGSPVHRMAVQAFAGGQGIPVTIQPQAEDGAATAATGEVDFAGTTGVLAGTLHMYLGGVYTPVAVTDAMTIEELTDACVAAITAKKELAVDGAKHAVTFELDLTSKSKGTFGNFISIAFNLEAGQVLPTGVAAAITGMSGGATDPDITDALDGLGTGDDANEAFYTDVVHGYGMVAAVLNKILTYVGAGDTTTGLYAKTVSRPFRVLTGDTVAGSAGLTAAQAIADARKTDRANGVISVPDSESHPSEIAALAIGHMARINQDRAAQHYVDVLLEGIWPGDKGSDRWTSDYDNRDTAVKGGISPTRVKSGNVYLQNVVSYYRPDSVPVDSNGYREMANISKIQNMMHTQREMFEQDTWQGISIVSDVTKVSSAVDRTKVRDIDSVKDAMVALYRAWESKAWIAEADFSIDALKETGSVTVRSGGDGFNITTKAILSGVGNIIDAVIEFDTSFASIS
jgi:phage tail sheath gpL-like